ncbi:DUF3379 domain-containing protein [Psychrosphaera sp. F3M07]|uniref:DUF3379 family protein n=1 Tax=Psychrosphaera sp. F3M07 TaxID=2841560 RepID=UPI001C09543E|nr:DUF3379 family protein [Psychrosphaera sp. F3M07]MBU2917820.1 DUF3379 domain-containing protein [Psychrosphaera sp. F3M07]
MDDLTFRKRIYANPHDNAQDIVDACQDDKNKAKFKSDMKTFDSKLKQALTVSTPDNLAEKILLSQSIDTQNGSSKRTKVHLAIAASVAVLVGVISVKFGLTNNFDNVGEYAIAHHNADIKHASDNYTYSLAQINSKLAAYGGEIIDALPNISFANTCYFGRIKSLHMVFQGEKFPVTVFLIPNETGLAQSTNFSDQDYNGETINVNNNQLLIITHKDDPNKDWSKQLTQSIKWKNV